MLSETAMKPISIERFNALVEATTVNPSDEVSVVDLENENAYYDGYVPRKFGSALFSKIKKKYWDYHM